MATRASSIRVLRGSSGLTSALASAILEWLLIFLLFIDALFSYLVTKFANFFGLQTPCLLCSRLDHIIGDEKPGFYRNLICHAHKSEISSLAYCHLHGKLANVREMCEGCLFSFSTEKKSNTETYRLLVGKLGPGLKCCEDEEHDIHLNLPIDADDFPLGLHGEDLAEEPLLKDPGHSTIGKKHCSCCNEPFRNTTDIHHRLLVQFKSISSTATEFDDVPLSGPNEHGCSHCMNNLHERGEKSYALTAVTDLVNHGFDPLSHVGYTEVKITSDSESEVLTSDDDDGKALNHEAGKFKDEILYQTIHPESDSIDRNLLHEIPSYDQSLQKRIHQAPIMEPEISVPYEQRNVDEPLAISSSVSPVAVGHGLDELNWHQVEENGSPLISENISPEMVPSSANLIDVPNEDSVEVNTIEIGDTACMPNSECKEVLEMENELASAKTGFNQITMEEPSLPTGELSISNSIDLNEAYKLATGNKGFQPSTSFSEQLTSKDSARIHEDLKVLLSQLSAARSFEFSWTDMSPRVVVHGDDLKTPDACSSMGHPMLYKRVSIERNESGFESLDGSIVSEIEGESVVDRLKRQIEFDRKSMNALYKELEEERNAASIAANQAMAMITRLQEEKAAMQMEALQYLRMMEEQAEYDQEALQQLNELLVQRERKIQALEEELGTYRKKFQNERLLDKELSPMTHFEGDCINFPCSCDENGSKGTDVHRDYEENKMGSLKDSLLDFEDEKLYITKSVERLEKMLQLFSNNGVYIDMSELDDASGDDHLITKYNDEDSVAVKENVDGNTEALGGMGHLHCDGMTHVVNQTEPEDRLPLQNNSFAYAESYTTPRWDMQLITEDNHNENCDELHSMNSKDTYLVAFGNEVSRLNERLETLEADQNFLKHTIYSLKNGNEGVQFIQEIADHLRELRRIGVTRNQQHIT